MPITINGTGFGVEPKFTEILHEKGAEHELQNGDVNYDVVKVKFEIELNFSLLTQAEFDFLEALKHIEGYATPSVTLVLNERIFDSATTDSILNRVLNKMKIKDFNPVPMTPYADSDTYRSLRMILRET